MNTSARKYDLRHHISTRSFYKRYVEGHEEVPRTSSYRKRILQSVDQRRNEQPSSKRLRETALETHHGDLLSQDDYMGQVPFTLDETTGPHKPENVQPICVVQALRNSEHSDEPDDVVTSKENLMDEEHGDDNGQGDPLSSDLIHGMPLRIGPPNNHTEATTTAPREMVDDAASPKSANTSPDNPS
uniref:Uncharacterized protein n=1 Tax=Knipowitschia caucasica TaxID=637954 RepID=A0AAV2MDA8_KNICA